MSTQPPQPPKLSQCRKCSEKGFQNIMIYFVQNGFNKSTGKPFWDLKNQDGTPHSHISPMVPSITTTPATTAAPTVLTTTNGTATKEQVQDRINQSHQENIAAWDRQTAALKELSSAILILATAINNRVIK